MAKPTRRTGTIKSLVDGKGFGFITTGDGPEFFFHHTGCTDCKFADLQIGARVSFVATEGAKGPRAEEIGLA